MLFYLLDFLLFHHTPCFFTHSIVQKFFENTFYHLYELLQSNPRKFWEMHEDIQKNIIPTEFKELFESMTNSDPISRATLEEVKSSDYFNGPVYSDEELSKYF